MRCEPNGDRTWDRLVATCYVGETDIGRRMIELGWAIPTHHIKSEDRAVDYALALVNAQEAERGLWAGDFIEPKDWRKGERLDGCE